MRKIFSILFVCFFSTVFSQELNCKVVVNYDKITNTNNQIFKSLETSLSEFVNKTVWTEKSYKPNYTEELFKVVELVEPNRDEKELLFNRQVQYKLADPNKKLPHYKKTFMRSELLRVK